MGEEQNDAAASVIATADTSSHITTIEIQRGPNNYFDVDVLGRVADLCEAAAEQGSRALVLCSEGKNFCAGADFTGDAGSTGGAGKPHVYDIAYRLFSQPLPMVAAVQGSAIGGGLGLALAADFRIGTPESRFAANFSLLGFHHGFALSVTLPRVVGNQRAMELLYTGRRIDGTTAHAMGLCDRLVETERLRDEAVALAAEIAAAAPLATRSIRATMRGSLAAEARDAMAHERAEQDRLRQTADFREGLAAVRERRPGSFTGR